MSIFKKISVFTMLLFISILLLAPVNADAATVGKQLTNPENGWQRIDDTDTNIIYSGTWLTDNNPRYSAQLWNGACNYCAGGNVSTSTFKFYGTKLRIIGALFTNKVNNNIVIIDNVEYTFNEYGTGTYRALVYEKTGLDLGVHTVVIKPSSTMTTSQNLVFDAIDIDDNGYLVPFSQISDLTATAGDTAVELNWVATGSAISYEVKRSLTPGGPYLTIGTTSELTYKDTGLTNGTTYYYVVSVIDTGIESNTNEASATPTEVPTPPDHTGDTATLILTMTNGDDKVYNVSLTELDAFLTWYDNRSNGNGRAYYTFTKTTNIAPYLSVKEYVSFDKISSFEVKEYNQ